MWAVSEVTTSKTMEIAMGDDDKRMVTAEPVPLMTPGGVVMAWACGDCHRVGRTGTYTVDAYTPEQVARMSESSRIAAATCCACRECKALFPWRGANIPRHNEHQPIGTCGACWTPERQAEAEARRAQLDEQYAAEARRVEESLARSSDVEAARALRSLMSDLSEDCYCAGWLIGTEDVLWAATATARDGAEVVPFEWGLGKVSVEDLVRLHTLARRAGGWWYSTTEYVTAFAPTEEWERMYAGRQVRR